MDPIAGGLGDADTDFLQQNQIIELYVTSKTARGAHVLHGTRSFLGFSAAGSIIFCALTENYLLSELPTRWRAVRTARGGPAPNQNFRFEYDDN
jgi:hypothetical protein